MIFLQVSQSEYVEFFLTFEGQQKRRQLIEKEIRLILRSRNKS